MIDSPYFHQVRLILRMMPYIAAEKRFALKGGTAINLFVRDMPRLSIDIDLVWLPLETRNAALTSISSALRGIANGIRGKMPQSSVQENRLPNTDHVVRLIVGTAGTMIKIEPNLVLRGTVFPCEERRLCKAAENAFELTTTATTASIADLYAGKLCAALDCQHPRDLFDSKVLLENEGITEDIRAAFVVYLASHDRPMSELFDPGRKDFRQAYKGEFAGMSPIHVDYAELVQVRERIIRILRETLSENERRFLLSIKEGHPDWALMPMDGIDQLPGIQWKLVNIQKMDRTKHAQATQKLQKVLGL